MIDKAQHFRNLFEEILVSASNEQKLKILSIFAHNITVVVRSLLVEENILKESLYNLNEIQHKVTSRVMNILSGEDEWSEIEFVESLYDYANDGNCVSELNYAIEVVCKFQKKSSDSYKTT
jgi:hypothetical protein